jgi:hypothetical protein
MNIKKRGDKMRLGIVEIDITFFFQLFNTALLVAIIVLIYKIGRKYLQDQRLKRRLSETEEALKVSQEALKTCEDVFKTIDMKKQ